MTRTRDREGSGLFCEDCNHEFLPGELMLLTYENDEIEMLTILCCDCLSCELVVETATPEDFRKELDYPIYAAPPSNEEGQ